MASKELIKLLRETEPGWKQDGLGLRGPVSQTAPTVTKPEWPKDLVTNRPSRALFPEATGSRTVDESSSVGGLGSIFSFKLENASTADGTAILVRDGEINEVLPDGMGNDDFLLPVNFDGEKIFAEITYDEETLEILSRDVTSESVAGLMPDAELGYFPVQIGYVIITYVETKATVVVHNTHCGDINFELVYGSMNGQPALLPVARLATWAPIPIP